MNGRLLSVLSSNLVLEKYIHVAFAYFSCTGQGEQVWRRPIDGRPAGCVRGKVRSDERVAAAVTMHARVN
jgi:hypothetical protein